MAGKVDTIRTEATLTADELEGLDKNEIVKGFIQMAINNTDVMYLKKAFNFKRVNNRDGSAVFTMRLNLDNK